MRPGLIGTIASRRGTGSGAAGGDPLWSYVTALLHFDGADGSTTFTDQKGTTWTARGNAQIDTAQSVYGGASGLFDGTGDYVDAPAGSYWNPGSADFCVEFWVRFASVVGQYVLLGQCDSAVLDASIVIQKQGGPPGANNIVATVVDGSQVNFGVCTDALSLSINTNYHYSYTRNGTGFTLRRDGTTVATATSSSTVHTSASKMAIGRLGEYSAVELGHNGWIDDLRITVGHPRYTSDFTPSGPHPDS